MSEKKTYVVLDPVDHNGKRYAPGRPIDLTEEEAEQLLGVRAIGSPTRTQGSVEPASGNDQSRVTALLDQLDSARTAVDQRDQVIGDLQRSLSEAGHELTQTQADLQAAQTARSELASQVAQLQAQLGELGAANQALTEQLTEATSKLEAQAGAGATARTKRS